MGWGSKARAGLDQVFGFSTQQVTVPMQYSMFSVSESSLDDPREGNAGSWLWYQGERRGADCLISHIINPPLPDPKAPILRGSKDGIVLFGKPCSLIWGHPIALQAENWAWVTQGNILRPFLGPQRCLEEFQVQRKPQNVMENTE